MKKICLWALLFSACIPGLFGLRLGHSQELRLRYSTYLGGSSTSNDKGFALAVDSLERVYLTGDVASADFPVRGPYQGSLTGGTSDIFVACLGSSGSELLYSTYLGGVGLDAGRGIEVDTDGRVYLTGYTRSPDFPTIDPYQPTLQGGDDALILCLSSSGSALIYSGYLGGSGDDYGNGIVLDSAGRPYLTGYTSSLDFPTRDPYQPAAAGGSYDAFAVSLDSSGSDLIYSTYLGGSGGDYGWAAAVDSSGRLYLGAETSSDDFPTVNPYQASRRGSWDGAAVALSSSGSALIYSSYFGGSDTDGIRGIVLDSLGRASLAGFTVSADFPTANPYQPGFAGGSFDGVAVTFSSSGSSLLYSTYLGGSGYDRAYGLALGPGGEILLTGRTDSIDFPTADPYQETLNGAGPDIFCSILEGSDSGLLYSTYLGGSGEDYGRAVAAGTGGAAFLTGYSWSPDFPTRDPYQSYNRGSVNVIIAKLEPGDATPTPLPTASPTSTPLRTATPVPTFSPDITATPSAVSSSSPSPALTPTPTPTPLSPALELAVTVDGLDDGAVAVSPPGTAHSCYYLVTNTGDTFLSRIEIIDDAGTPSKTEDDILIGIVSGLLAGGETVEFSRRFESRSFRFNTAIAEGDPTDAAGDLLCCLCDVSASDSARTVNWETAAGNDYDGDGSPDLVNWDYGEGRWYIRFSSGYPAEEFYFGRAGDFAAPGDYNGDGLTDPAVFRAEIGLWAVRSLTRIYFGRLGDIPIPADYDADGTADIAVFRPEAGLWAVRGISRFYFGDRRDEPVPAQYGVGLGAEAGIFRSQSGLWAVRRLTRSYFGSPDDYPVPADYNGDGITDVAVFRDWKGLWAVAAVTRFYFGNSDDNPQPADYDGSGRNRAAIYRPATGLWAVRGMTREYWGSSSTIPLSR